MRHSHTGRHGPGHAPIHVPRQAFDLEQRDIARRLDQAEPYWVIWYGVGARHYFAVPVWETPGALILCARSAENLVEQMRAVEDGRWPG